MEVIFLTTCIFTPTQFGCGALGWCVTGPLAPGKGAGQGVALIVISARGGDHSPLDSLPLYPWL